MIRTLFFILTLSAADRSFARIPMGDEINWQPGYLETLHQFRYEIDGRIPARVLADAIIGLEGLVSQSTLVLRALVPDLGRIKAEVLIQEIRFGSLEEDFWVRVFFGKGKERERNIEKLRKVLGLKNMSAKRMFTYLMGAGILFGVYHFLKSDGQPTLHIENSFNSIGKELNLTPDEMMAMYETVLGGRKEDLKKDVVRTLHPGGSDKVEEIKIDGGLSIPPEVIKAVPTKYEKSDDNELLTDKENVQIVIRAMDLDRPAVGWWCIIPELGDNRLPVHVVAADVDLNKVPIGKYFQGDVTILHDLELFARNLALQGIRPRSEKA